MSGSITTSRGYEWSEAPVDMINALQHTANPVARVDEGAVGDLELVAADIATIAAGVTPPVRLTYTTVADIVCAPNATTNVHAIGGSFLLTEFVAMDQPDVVPLLGLRCSAYIASVSAIQIIGRNLTNAAITIPTGTKFNMVRI